MGEQTVSLVTGAAGDLPAWRSVAGFVVPAGFFVAVAFLIAKDSAARGRSGFRWLLACVFLGPLGIFAFVVVAVLDRLAGRRGIESRWTPAGRPYSDLGARSAGSPPALAAAQATVANRCSAAAADRMADSTICLGGAWLLALIGESRNRRRDRPGSGQPAEATI